MTDFILQDVQVFTGETSVPVGYVAVRDGLIYAVGPGAPPSNLAHIPRYSFPNYTVLPGMIDCHVHAFLGDDGCMSTSLQFGITTVLDMHNEPEFVKRLKALAADPAHYSTHADFKTSGLAASIENGYPYKLITDFVKDPEAIAASKTWTKLKAPEEADQYVQDRIQQGSDYIKLFHESGKTWGWDLTLPTQALQEAIIQAAHRRNLKTVAHAMAIDDTLSVLRAGVDGMAHTFCDEPITDEIVAAYKRNNAWVCPTLAATGSMTSEGLGSQTEIARDSRVAAIIGEEESERLCSCMGTCHGRGKLEYAIDSVKVLRAEGIEVVCGSDSVGPGKPGVGWGASYIHELNMFVEDVGMTSEEALRTATSVPARRFGFKDRGLLEPGRLADLVLVKGNPVQDIGDLMNIEGIWRKGVVCERHKDVLRSKEA